MRESALSYSYWLRSCTCSSWDYLCIIQKACLVRHWRPWEWPEKFLAYSSLGECRLLQDTKMPVYKVAMAAPVLGTLAYAIVQQVTV